MTPSQIDRYTGLRNAAKAIVTERRLHGDHAYYSGLVERLELALEAAPTFTNPTPLQNRVVCTVDGGIVQGCYADRPDEVLVTVLDFDVESADHPSVYRVTDAYGERVLVGVDLPVAEPFTSVILAMLGEVSTEGDASDVEQRAIASHGALTPGDVAELDREALAEAERSDREAGAIDAASDAARDRDYFHGADPGDEDEDPRKAEAL